MKTLQAQRFRVVQAVSERTGRRVLTITCNSTRRPVRRRSAGRHSGRFKLVVQSALEDLSGFEPVIRFRPGHAKR